MFKSIGIAKYNVNKYVRNGSLSKVTKPYTKQNICMFCEISRTETSMKLWTTTFKTSVELKILCIFYPIVQRLKMFYTRFLPLKMFYTRNKYFNDDCGLLSICYRNGMHNRMSVSSQVFRNSSFKYFLQQMLTSLENGMLFEILL